MPTVIEIVKERLKAEGLDGLANADSECGCYLDDLAPCGEIGGDCRAGRKAVIDGEVVCVEADNVVPTQTEIASRLRVLAGEMDDIAVCMDYYGGLSEWAQHGREIAGAGNIARQWAEEIEGMHQTSTSNDQAKGRAESASSD